MMTQAFYTGISGIRSNQTAIDITSDNIANISTIGFRGSQAEFSTLFESALNTPNNSLSSSNTVGLGTQIHATSMMEAMGTMQQTDRNTDLAIDGDGWFGIKNGDETLYTRAGDFLFDSNSDLTTIDGKYVLGTMANNIENDVLTKEVPQTFLGDIDAQETLRFPKSLLYPPIPTQHSSFYGNLGIDDVPRIFGTTVVDKDNNKNNLKLEFTKSEQQVKPGMQWDVVATTQTLDGTTIYDKKVGKAYFDAHGAMISHTLSTIDNNGTEVKIDLGEGYGGIVATNTPFVEGSSKSDGTIGGSLVGYEINEGGEVIATFTNGAQSSVGKIALYHFNNEQGLQRVSGTRYKESSNSGRAVFVQDKDGKSIQGANVINYRLEGSNIMTAYALTELIVLQRSFDANSKIITTADQMIQKALGMHK